MLVSLIVLVPLYFTISMALKTPAADRDRHRLLAAARRSISSNFSDAWTLVHFPRAFGYSAFITFVAVLGEVFLSSLAAFAIVRNWDHRLFRCRTSTCSRRCSSRSRSSRCRRSS